jgi:thiamine monophosphate kinase
MTLPNQDDVVIRQKRSNSSIVYLLGTLAAPDQLSFRLRDDAMSKAIAYAKHQHVRAWFANGDDDFVLLGTFREEHATDIKSDVARRAGDRRY